MCSCLFGIQILYDKTTEGILLKNILISYIAKNKYQFTMIPPVMEKFYDGLEKICRARGILAGKSGRHMKFPYTFTAKIAQFPVFFYMKNNPIWMYYPCGCLLGWYLFSYIHAVVNSDANKKSWAEQQMKAAAKEHH